MAKLKTFNSQFIGSLILAALFGEPATAAEPIRLLFSHSVQVAKPDNRGAGTPESFEPEAEIKLDPETIYFVTAKGKVPLLVMPIGVKADQEKVRVDLPNVAAWAPTSVEQEIDTKVTALVDDLFQFQLAIIAKDVEKAQRLLDRMQATRDLEYFHFLRASLSFVKGDMKNAKESVKKGLSRYPANEQGQRLLKTIEGNRP